MNQAMQAKDYIRHEAECADDAFNYLYEATGMDDVEHEEKGVWQFKDGSTLNWKG